LLVAVEPKPPPLLLFVAVFPHKLVAPALFPEEALLFEVVVVPQPPVPPLLELELEFAPKFQPPPEPPLEVLLLF